MWVIYPQYAAILVNYYGCWKIYNMRLKLILIDTNNLVSLGYNILYSISRAS